MTYNVVIRRSWIDTNQSFQGETFGPFTLKAAKAESDRLVRELPSEYAAQGVRLDKVVVWKADNSADVYIVKPS